MHFDSLSLIVHLSLFLHPATFRVWAYWSVLADLVHLADRERLLNTLLSLLQSILTPASGKSDPSFNIAVHFMSQNVHVLLCSRKTGNALVICTVKQLFPFRIARKPSCKFSQLLNCMFNLCHINSFHIDVISIRCRKKIMSRSYQPAFLSKQSPYNINVSLLKYATALSIALWKSPLLPLLLSSSEFGSSSKEKSVPYSKAFTSFFARFLWWG